MKAPKILPWIARRAGLSDELAFNLWRRAAGEAEVLCGNCASSEYYGLAVERLIDLAQEESEKCAAPVPCSLSLSGLNWMPRYQQQMWQINLLGVQKACRLWQDAWINLITGHPA